MAEGPLLLVSRVSLVARLVIEEVRDRSHDGVNTICAARQQSRRKHHIDSKEKQPLAWHAGLQGVKFVGVEERADGADTGHRHQERKKNRHKKGELLRFAAISIQLVGRDL